ncbi:ROK family protein [Chloroflexota bacterium]
MKPNNNIAKKPVLAVDIGGTKILATIISPDYKIMAEERLASVAFEGPDAVISRIFSGIDTMLGQYKCQQLHSISIASAGIIDTNQGIITHSPNLPGWVNMPLRGIIKDRYKMDTHLINDASAAALSEHRFGAGRGLYDLVYVTVSTGIGGGIIIDGRLYTGASGCAGEVGHMIIDAAGQECLCGSRGCLEALSSGIAMAREAVKRMKNGENTLLRQMSGGNTDKITAELIADAARRGDKLAIDVINQAASYLGMGLANIVNIFNPEMIIIGGGVSKMGGLLFEPAKRVMNEKAFKLPAGAVRVVPAELGDNMGVLGAAVFALEQE